MIYEGEGAEAAGAAGAGAAAVEPVEAALAGCGATNRAAASNDANTDLPAFQVE
jgi:hypothetical protein